MIGFQNRSPQNEFRNIWFRNNIFWDNTGGAGYYKGIDSSGVHFLNNLWNVAYPGDSGARTGNPHFVDPKSSSPEGYQLKTGSAAVDAGMLLYENQHDFWFSVRPKTGAYDIGAHEFGTSGKAHIGLDMAQFPFEVTPFKLQFKAKPTR